jgi:hypothetical protein
MLNDFLAKGRNLDIRSLILRYQSVLDFDFFVLDAVEVVGHQEQGQSLAVEKVRCGARVQDLGDRVVGAVVERYPVVPG